MVARGNSLMFKISLTNSLASDDPAILLDISETGAIAEWVLDIELFSEFERLEELMSRSYDTFGHGIKPMCSAFDLIGVINDPKWSEFAPVITEGQELIEYPEIPNDVDT